MKPDDAQSTEARETAPLISVTIVCYNSVRDIERCLTSLLAQNWPHFEVIVIDNASTDGSGEALALFPSVQTIVNPLNVGFSAAQNQALRHSRGDFIVSLNLDTRTEPSFLRMLWAAMQVDGTVGIVCPKILRMSPDGTPSMPARLDSAGVYATPDMRHHHRGFEEEDRGQYQRAGYVFGYTGAAAMFRRSMLDELAVDGMVLDEDFFAFREDSDLSWRAHLAGWRCLYTPHAVVYHKRHVFENDRKRVSALINMHSTKNRFLLRINNLTAAVFWKTLIPATVRDVGVIAYVLTKEHSSLPGLRYVFRERRRLFRKRAAIQAKRRVSDSGLLMWFAWAPTFVPLNHVSEDHLLQNSVLSEG